MVFCVCFCMRHNKSWEIHPLKVLPHFCIKCNLLVMRDYLPYCVTHQDASGNDNATLASLHDEWVENWNGGHVGVGPPSEPEITVPNTPPSSATKSLLRENAKIQYIWDPKLAFWMSCSIFCIYKQDIICPMLLSLTSCEWRPRLCLLSCNHVIHPIM